MKKQRKHYTPEEKVVRSAACGARERSLPKTQRGVLAVPEPLCRSGWKLPEDRGRGYAALQPMGF
jgi:hypothetical protein